MKTQRQNILKVFFVFSLNFLICTTLFAQNASSARALAEEATKKENLEQSIAHLKKGILKLELPAEKRSAYAFLGGVQEQMGNFQEALSSYASAAAIAATDAPNMPKKSSEQLVIDAVRCALSSGNWNSAQNYLNSAVRNSSDKRIISYVKLYEQWSILCKASKIEDTVESVALLKTYSSLESMKIVWPQILLTLWHITGENTYSERLKKDFSKTPEAAIVKGEIQTLPAPFWYFVPRSSTATPEVENATTKVDTGATSTTAKEEKAKSDVKNDSKADKIVRQQLGLFKEKANAESLVARLKEKGFSAKITSEVRPSGTTYYIVAVDENKTLSIGDELRTAGFECYPVFE